MASFYSHWNFFIPVDILIPLNSFAQLDPTHVPKE